MNWNVDVLLALAAGLAAGAGFVLVLLRRSGAANRERADVLATELEETRLELEAHREEVTKHFGQTSNLFRDLTAQYTRLYAHLAEGAREFCPDAVPSLSHGLDTPLLVDDGPVETKAPEPGTDAASAPEERAVADATEADLPPTPASKPNGGAQASL